MLADEAAGPKRSRKTRRSVLVADRIADMSIRTGGIFVILAVFGIMAYLVQVVLPLVSGGAVESHRAITVPHRGPVLMQVLDEYRTLAVSLDRTGAVSILHLASGRAIPAPAFAFRSRYK